MYAMKKIEIFDIVVTIIIIIVIAISVYFACKNYFFFLPIVLSILLLLYIWLGYFFDEDELKTTPQKFEVIPKKYRNTLK
jgi:hypothetical protein